MKANLLLHKIKLSIKMNTCWLDSTECFFRVVYFCVMTIHETYLQRCVQLARLGAGRVAPNPLVGAVLVHHNRIIGEGYHRQFGEAHAEVNCINSVASMDKALVNKSTLYVSLEPCAHFGKTPPCTNLIIANHIPHVVIGSRDNFEAVNGKGIEALQAAGIQVDVAVLEKDCLELNKRFFTFQEKICLELVLLKLWLSPLFPPVVGLPVQSQSG
jgi:diaminohydroxyphosphoribosylaminopyrimidine deaminase/5-amino-6-(5-phosphoribosylamino)uracil reductase